MVENIPTKTQARKWENLFHYDKACSLALVGRPKKQPQDRVKKDAFSGPRYLIAAAKTAAGVPQGKEFSPWLVTAIEQKLNRDYPGLIDRVRAALQQNGDSRRDFAVAEASSTIDEMVAWAVEIELGAIHGGGEASRGTGSPYAAKPETPRPRKKRT